MIHLTPPPDWHLGPFIINIHSLMFCIGALTAFAWTYKHTPERYRQHLDDIACWMTAGGIIGARLMFVLLYPQTLISPIHALYFWEGGLVSYGGFFGAAAAWIACIRYKKLPMNVLCDALGPALPLGWGIGRIGCFLSWNNEFGTPTSLPWGFIVNNDIPRHPVMLYLAVSHITVAFLAVWASKRWHVNAMGPALIGFGGGRLILDIWRFYDPFWLHYGSASISLFFFIAGCLMLKGLPPADAIPGGEADEAAADQTEQTQTASRP